MEYIPRVLELEINRVYIEFIAWEFPVKEYGIDGVARINKNIHIARSSNGLKKKGME